MVGVLLAQHPYEPTRQRSLAVEYGWPKWPIERVHHPSAPFFKVRRTFQRSMSLWAAEEGLGQHQVTFTGAETNVRLRDVGVRLRHRHPIDLDDHDRLGCRSSGITSVPQHDRIQGFGHSRSHLPSPHAELSLGPEHVHRTICGQSGLVKILTSSKKHVRLTSRITAAYCDLYHTRHRRRHRATAVRDGRVAAHAKLAVVSGAGIVVVTVD